MRNLPATILILLANLMILAHAFLPHHHHENHHDGDEDIVMQSCLNLEHEHPAPHNDNESSHHNDCKITDSLAGAVQRTKNTESSIQETFQQLLFVATTLFGITPVSIKISTIGSGEVPTFANDFIPKNTHRRGPPNFN